MKLFIKEIWIWYGLWPRSSSRNGWWWWTRKWNWVEVQISGVDSDHSHDDVVGRPTRSSDAVWTEKAVDVQVLTK